MAGRTIGFGFIGLGQGLAIDKEDFVNEFVQFSAKRFMSSASKTKKGFLRGLALAEQDAPKRDKLELVSDSIATGLMFALVLTLGQRVIGFGRGILFCRLMTDQQLGQWSMVWSYLMLLAPLAVLGLPGCFGKYTEYFRQRGQFIPFVSRIAAINLASTLSLCAAIFAFPETFSWILFRQSSEVELVRWIAIALVFVTANNFLCSLLESLRQVRVVTLMRFATGVTFSVVAIGLLYATSGDSSSATIGYAVGCLIGAIPAVWILWKYRGTFSGTGQPLGYSSMWKRIAPFAIWLWVSNLLNNLFEISDRYMLIHWSPSSAEIAQGSVGQYHSGRVVPLLMVGIASMMAALLLPYMSAAWEAGKKDEARRQLNWAVKLVSIWFTLGGSVILLMAPFLFEYVFQGRYNDGLAVLPLTLVYCIWYALHTLGQDYLWVAEKGKWATAATAMGLIVNVGLNLALIPLMGLWGAVIATATGNLLIVVVMFMLNHHFGCKTDRGVWLAAFMPLILLTGTAVATIASLTLLAVCLTTELVFSVEEKADVMKIVRSKLARRR